MEDKVHVARKKLWPHGESHRSKFSRSCNTMENPCWNSSLVKDYGPCKSLKPKQLLKNLIQWEGLNIWKVCEQLYSMGGTLCWSRLRAWKGGWSSDKVLSTNHNIHSSFPHAASRWKVEESGMSLIQGRRGRWKTIVVLFSSLTITVCY